MPCLRIGGLRAAWKRRGTPPLSPPGGSRGGTGRNYRQNSWNFCPSAMSKRLMCASPIRISSCLLLAVLGVTACAEREPPHAASTVKPLPDAPAVATTQDGSETVTPPIDVRVVRPRQTLGPASTEPTVDPRFVRDQPNSRGLDVWNGSLVARTSPPLSVNVVAATSRALDLPKDCQALQLATYGSTPVALCGSARGPAYLAEWTGTRWRERALPQEALMDWGAKPVLLTGGTTLTVVTADHIHRLAGEDWISRTVSLPGDLHRDFPEHRAESGGRLYFGYDHGEFGGQLVSLDLQRGEWRDDDADMGEAGSLPVRDIEIDRDGRLWVVRGLSHLNLLEGALFVLGPGGWQLFASSRGSAPIMMVGSEPRHSHSAISFSSVAFDEKNRPHLLSGSAGVVRIEQNGGLTRLTPEWPGFVYVDGLVIIDHTAAIGTSDSGVLLLNMETGRLYRVSLEQQGMPSRTHRLRPNGRAH